MKTLTSFIRSVPSAALSLVFAVLLAMPPSEVYADITGWTEMELYTRQELNYGYGSSARYGDERLIRRERLLNSGAEGTFLEAVIDGAQLALAIKDVVASIAAGNPVGVILGAQEAIREAQQLRTSAGDHWAVETASISINRGNVHRVELKFHCDSNDAPFQSLRITTPPGLAGLEQGADSKHKSAIVRLLPRELPMGKYIVSFRAKEDDCHICLGIVHIVEITLYGELDQRPCNNKAYCDQVLAELGRLERMCWEKDRQMEQKAGALGLDEATRRVEDAERSLEEAEKARNAAGQRAENVRRHSGHEPDPAVERDEESTEAKARVKEAKRQYEVCKNRYERKLKEVQSNPDYRRLSNERAAIWAQKSRVDSQLWGCCDAPTPNVPTITAFPLGPSSPPGPPTPPTGGYDESGAGSSYGGLGSDTGGVRPPGPKSPGRPDIMVLPGPGGGAPLGADPNVGSEMQRREQQRHMKELGQKSQELEGAGKAPASPDRRFIDGRWWRKTYLENPPGSGKYKELWRPEEQPPVMEAPAPPRHGYDLE